MDITVHERIRQDVADNPVVLYMKGSPVFPQCGFSAAVVQILSHLGVKFKGVDVLADPGIRQGIKEFSNWPTIPQLYVKGEFIGGCDIIREMYETGELQQVLEQKILERQTFGLQRLYHRLGLIRRDDRILCSLEKSDRRRESIGKMNRRPLVIEILSRRIGADQPVEIA